MPKPMIVAVRSCGPPILPLAQPEPSPNRAWPKPNRANTTHFGKDAKHPPNAYMSPKFSAPKRHIYFKASSRLRLGSFRCRRRFAGHNVQSDLPFPADRLNWTYCKPPLEVAGTYTPTPTPSSAILRKNKALAVLPESFSKPAHSAIKLPQDVVARQFPHPNFAGPAPIFRSRSRISPTYYRFPFSAEKRKRAACNAALSGSLNEKLCPTVYSAAGASSSSLAASASAAIAASACKASIAA